ncbi:MAG TPA: PQQ-dependent sugar dehydrogenase [Clostridia bacterium]|nr:PQQ-dependent sugar dehydrogenase [Clostridia bacterium]
MPGVRASGVRLRWLIAVTSLALLLGGCGGDSSSPSANAGGGGTPTGGGNPTGGGGAVTLATEVVASGLTVPWEMVWAPDGRMFFTEQPGLLRVMVNGNVQAAPVLDLTSIVPGGEAGMLGLELDRSFASNHFLYIFYCLTTGGVHCRVSRFTESNNSIAPGSEQVLIETAAGPHHEAGRIKIGPDGLLYVAVGDVFDPQTAQDLTRNEGKILRMNVDGSAAAGNPFPENPFVYTLGHRDPQGLAFDSSGQLYSTEHGPISNDEVNIINAGKNYGWPTCIGRCNDPRFVDPIKLFSPETAAPSGATFYNGSAIPQWNGSLLFATLGLAGNTFAHHLHRIKFDRPGGTNIVEEEVLFRDAFGRLRNVAVGPDGFVYISTSNGGGQDKIIRIRPK